MKVVSRVFGFLCLCSITALLVSYAVAFSSVFDNSNPAINPARNLWLGVAVVVFFLLWILTGVLASLATRRSTKSRSIDNSLGSVTAFEKHEKAAAKNPYHPPSSS